MRALTELELLSAALFFLTASLLIVAGFCTSRGVKRIVTALSVLAVLGADYFMIKAYRGGEALAFDRSPPERQTGQRGGVAFESQEGPGSTEDRGTSGRRAGPRESGPDRAQAVDGAGFLGSSRIAALLAPPSRGLLPGNVVKDCADCPDIVVIEGAFFSMGASAGDALAAASERPVRTVKVGRRLAIGITEVTVGEYAAFLKETGWQAMGCGSQGPAHDPMQPATCVSWRDAMSYVAWLRERTGKGYRLPTEAEWEYAARGRSVSRFVTGSEIEAKDANVGRRALVLARVGSHPANAYGLHDMHGNVAEMVFDCWSETLRYVPGDASRANRRGECKTRVLRDAAADEPASLARLSARRPVEPHERSPRIGFRVARDY